MVSFHSVWQVTISRNRNEAVRSRHTVNKQNKAKQHTTQTAKGRDQSSEMYGGDDSYVDEPCFAVHGAVPVGGGGRATAVGRILSIRYQDACIDDFPPEEVRIIAGSSSGSNSNNTNNKNNTSNASAAVTQSSAAEYANLVKNTDPSCPVSVVFIERAASSSSSSFARKEGRGDDPYAHLGTIVHAYTPTPSVSEYLRATGDPVLIEDAAFLSFLIAGGSDATSSLLLRSGFHKRLKPIHEENLRLKAEMKALRSENNQLRAIIANMNNNSYRNTYTSGAGNNENDNAAGSSSGVGTSSPYRTVSPTSFLRGNNTTTTSSQRGNNNANATQGYESVCNYDDASAISVHSPLQWETETEAAVNARTRYNPYRSEEEKARRSKAGAGRHAESVSHLIARLHDKSCDDRDKRLASYEAAVISENERYTERKTLSYDEQKDLGTRLHDVASTKKKKMLETLETTFYPPVERRTFDSEAIAKSNERIYREPMDKKQKGLEKLIQTYVYDHEDKLPKVKLTKEQQQAMADRLSQRNR